MIALYRIFIAGIAAAVPFAVAAQTVVVGTGDPDIDIAAVQAAVDRGGAVVLRGHFSFNNPPARRLALPGLMATIRVSKEVTISGAWDEHGEITAIQGGEIPFAVEAPGARVRVERVRFVRPRLAAIFVDEVNGFEIDSCAIEGLEPAPLPGFSTGLSYGIGIYVSTLLGLPTPERPGNPGKVSGRLSILDNRISLGAGADHGIGIMIVTVGKPEKPVEVDVAGNTVLNSTLKGINVMQIGGQARIAHNIVTGRIDAGGRERSAGIHCGGSGLYLISGNVINMSGPKAAGIRIRGYPRLDAAIERATITDNDVTMSHVESAILGLGSAGIEIMGLARGTVVQRNKIRGRAGVGLSMAPDTAGIPTGGTFDRNDQEHFVSTLADGGKQ